MKVIIADDNTAFSDALSFFITMELGIEIAAIYHNGLELITNCNDDAPTLILTDIEMPKLNGIEAIRKIKQQHPNTLAIAITSQYEKVYQLDLEKNGFNGCVLKDQVYKTLSDAIKKVSAGYTYFNY